MSRKRERPDRDKLYDTLRVTYGVSGKRLAALQSDLEPVFRMADVALEWPEGTDCGLGFTGGARGPHDSTRPMPEPEAAAPWGDLQPCREFYDDGKAKEIAERFHEQACAVLGERRMVDLGSLLGVTLLDALFQRISRVQPVSCILLQFLAYYRIAAAVAWMETEASMLSAHLRDFHLEAATWVDTQIDESYDEISVVQPVG